MNKQIELLAPGGGVDAIKAAIIAGANAIYCGLDNFNARDRANNVTLDELKGVLRLAHQYDCRVFLTLNIVLLEHEFKSMATLLNQLVNTSLDGIIVQDLGMFNLVKKHFPSLDIHASTQLTTHNTGQIKFLHKLGASRVNLSRELNLREIAVLSAVGKEYDVITEVFVHGSLCVAFSGLCYSTSATVGNSGNRGRCSQACREQYETTEAGNDFPLNLKDNSALLDLPALIDAGVYSLKIEGRIKGANYVHTVVDSWRKQIDGYVNSGLLVENGSSLYKVFNRDFSNSFLKGDLNQSMFIDNPRDHSIKHAVDSSNAISVVQIQEVEQDIYDEKKQIASRVEEKIQQLSIAKAKVTLRFSGKLGEDFVVGVEVIDHTSEDKQFELRSISKLSQSETFCIDQSAIRKRFKSINSLGFELSPFDISNLETGLSLPFKELTILKNELVYILNDSKALIPAVDLPVLEKNEKQTLSARLSILIADEEDINSLEKVIADDNVDVFFKLPESYKRNCTKHAEIFLANPNLIPWFPSVLIGKDYDVAVNLLKLVQPKLIVTNNTGIAYEAFELGIKWIAGPFLNTTNSYCLMTLKEELDCHGAFVSNEISQKQIKHIARPGDFKLYYSIYHPILMMISRQCFFQQSVGCDKPRIDNGCMLSCAKATTITNMKGELFAIDKQKAGYPSIYNQDPFLNTNIVSDLIDLFDGFMIDLTNIGSGDRSSPDKLKLVSLFESLLKGDNVVTQEINTLVPESTVQQYIQGL